MRNPGSAKVVLSIAAVLCWTATASAQLDPLMILRRVPPTIIVVFDNSLAMLQDGNGNFYDPAVYDSLSDVGVTPAFPDVFIGQQYRRVFKNFHYGTSSNKFTASSISTDTTNLTDAAFLAPTRWQIARNGLAQAISENNNATSRWGLIRLRQVSPSWRASGDCDKPVLVSDANQSNYTDTTPCDAGGIGKFVTYAPKVGNSSYKQSSAPSGTVMVTPGAGTATSMSNIVTAGVGNASALIPAGIGGQTSSGTDFADRPLSFALDDAKAAVQSAMSADSSSNRPCRNYVIVLVTGGQDSGDSSYLSTNNLVSKASAFTAITVSGTTRRVPIHVIGVKVAAAEEAQLRSVASSTGGAYHNVATEAEVTRWVNYAVQAGYARQSDVDTGNPSEYVTVSPIIGTVNMTSGKDATGVRLPNDVIYLGGPSADPTRAAVVPQRSNVLISAGFEMPGFAGRLRAFRVYAPVADSTKPSGWKFVNDGTKLWPDLDGRTSLAGQARTPIDPATRNIYTYIPNSTGGGSMVAFTTANASTLAAHMNLTSTAAATMIDYVRQQPLGAFIGSTPALMDPPSLDPPPDDQYGRSDATTSTFASDHKNRRSIIFAGGNDGMMHAIDARTGYEVWAFIPYNLLPKLRTLYDGQPVDQFEYFVDSSPKLAEVKISGVWRSLLLFGQGPGGTFYQCFDVSEAGMGVSPERDTISDVTALLQQFDTPNESIVFKWAFPNYGHFDPTIKKTFTLSDGTAGNKLVMWGDLSSSATYAEKTVGFTWSDPAVGPLDSTRTVNGVLVGSGYFPNVEASLPNRGSSIKAGATMYILSADTGAIIGNATQSACSGSGCISIAEVTPDNGRKNALQADPTAAGDYGSPVVKKAYVGDIDGRYWRFDFGSSGAIAATKMTDTGQPIYASSALLFIGSVDVYMFFATGSDSLPASPSTTGGTGQFKLLGLQDNGSSALTEFSLNLASVSYDSASSLTTGERASTAPTVAGDIVFYTTTVEDSTKPCVDFSANLYAVTYTGTAAYDSTGDGRVTSGESAKVKTMVGRATAPFVVDQHLYVGTSSGSGGLGSGDGTGTGSGAKVEAFGDPEDFNNGVGQVGVRILSWREIR